MNPIDELVTCTEIGLLKWLPIIGGHATSLPNGMIVTLLGDDLRLIPSRDVPGLYMDDGITVTDPDLAAALRPIIQMTEEQLADHNLQMLHDGLGWLGVIARREGWHPLMPLVTKKWWQSLWGRVVKAARRAS